MDKKLLDILRCPASGGVLQYDSDTRELISAGAAVAYPVRDGIPVLLVAEGRKLDAAECSKYGIGQAGENSV